MKKALLGGLIALSAVAVNAKCIIHSVGSGALAEQLKEKGWNLPAGRFDVICAKLEGAHADIFYASQATVLSNTSVGWVQVMIGDDQTPESRVAITDYTSASTVVNNHEASMNVANDLAYDALMRAVAGWTNIDKAIATLQEVRKKGY